MTLRLRNTLTRSVDEVQPLEPGRVRMYTCGPTVYRYAHIGNLRSYLLADLVRRALLARGIDVFQVKNITDVGHLRDERFDRGEDKMLVQARLEDKSPEEIARFYEATFHDDERAANILPAHLFPRATDHIAQMVAMTERLVDAGFAYATTGGTVYFSVASFPGYGRLSGNTLDELRAGHRGEVERDKRDPADFALWKAAGEGRIVRWPTPRWGEGFPGWHIECSAMATTYLGEQFDIHTGGIDNVFPHHEDEIAQSAALSGVVPACHWVHGEHLLMGGRRMAKSAGNFVRITELGDGVEPLAFRMLCLTSRYRAKLNVSSESLAAAQAGLESLRGRARAIGRQARGDAWPGGLVAAADRAAGTPGTGGVVVPGVGVADSSELAAPAREAFARWTAAIDDDLDLPRALAAVREAVKDAQIPAAERRWLLLEADRVLGLDLAREIELGAALPDAGREQLWHVDAAAATGSEPAWAASGPAAQGPIEGTAPVSLPVEPSPDARARPPGDGGSGLPAEAAALLRERAGARAARDWARSDELRVKLAALGVEVVDRPGGVQEWRVREA